MSPKSRSQLNIKYYNWRDLSIGATVKVYGRDMLIYDCDAFTKKWYKVRGLCPIMEIWMEIWTNDGFGNLDGNLISGAIMKAKQI